MKSPSTAQIKGLDVTFQMNIKTKFCDIIKYLKNEKNQKLNKNGDRKNGPKRSKLEKRRKFIFKRVILIKKQKKNEHC